MLVAPVCGVRTAHWVKKGAKPSFRTSRSSCSVTSRVGEEEGELLLGLWWTQARMCKYDIIFTNFSSPIDGNLKV